MKIDSLNTAYINNDTNHNFINKKNNDNKVSRDMGDRIEISNKAKELKNLKASFNKAKDLEEITQRIKNGYYNDEKVLNHVADSILNSEDLNPSANGKV